MNNFSVKAESLSKTFGRRLIFSGLNFEFSKKGIYGISGPNGSGKSTLVQIIAGLISPSAGKVRHIMEDKDIPPEKLHNHIGFVSPYLVLYEEFTALENLELFAKIRNVHFNTEKIEYLLKVFLLYERKDDLVKTYSSGMKQRMKFIFAMMHSPRLLILDEPTSNLDDEGKESVYRITREQGSDSIVLIASNERSDLELCSEKIVIQDYKNISVQEAN
ncbi:MAG TPA: ABC transporter ATP-binding protein [Ignavibacteriaceae bacterium]|jgi:heme exporter protein A|nr:ABC transporter ATP-binding protein [Ignavibacteriaceae bacterium]